MFFEIVFFCPKKHWQLRFLYKIYVRKKEFFFSFFTLFNTHKKVFFVPKKFRWWKKAWDCMLFLVDQDCYFSFFFFRPIGSQILNFYSVTKVESKVGVQKKKKTNPNFYPNNSTKQNKKNSGRWARTKKERKIQTLSPVLRQFFRSKQKNYFVFFFHRFCTVGLQVKK